MHKHSTIYKGSCCFTVKMHIIYSLRVSVIIALLIAYVAAAADLEINRAAKVGADAANLNVKLDPINKNVENDVDLGNNSLSNQVKSEEAGDRRKTNNSNANVDEVTDFGDQTQTHDSSLEKVNERKGLKESEGEKKRNDSSSKMDTKEEELKEAEGEKNTNDSSSIKDDKIEELKKAGLKEKANNSGSDKQGDKEKLLSDGLQSKRKTLPTRKESFHGEECDSSSYGCTIEENSMVACLRVPGDESPDLSLMVQNKGKGTVSVLITAPEYVQLERNKIELQGNENNKMKVSIGDAGDDNFIILKTGDGQCTLDFRGLIDHSDKTSQFKYVVFPSYKIMCLAAMAVVATVWTCIKWRALVSGGNKYQKLDMALPVSSGGKTETHSNDGWDNSWDDNWDDEEAPKTPSLPLTPSISSKGISSRRSGKEGWKD